MSQTLKTKDGIVINNIPDDVDLNGPDMRQRVAEERAKRDGTAMPTPPMETPAAQDPTPSVVPPTGLERAGNLAMEGVAGFNRATLGTADFLTSPLQAIAQVGGFDLPTFSEQGTPRGAFAGDGLATDMAAGAGELANLSAVSGGILRKAAQSLDDVVRFVAPSSRDATTLNVIRTLGNTTAADDIALGGVSGAGGAGGGELGVLLGGENFRDIGKFTGEVVSPAAWMGATQSLMRVGKSLIDNTADVAPSTANLKTASQLLYNKLDEAGVTTSQPSTAALTNQLNKFMSVNEVSRLSGQGPLYNTLQGIKKEAEANGGLTFGLLNDIVSGMRKRAKGNTDQASSITREAADLLDSFLDTAALNVPVGSANLDASEVRNAARGLWRRSSVAKNIDDMMETALIDSEETGKSFVPAFRKKLNNLRKPDSEEGKFLTKKEKEMIGEVIRGGGVEKMLNLAGSIGFSSNDLIRSIIIGGATTAVVTGTVMSGPAVGAGAGGAIVGVTLIADVLKGRAANIFKKNATAMRAYMRAGSNAEDITRLYTRSTPRAERDPTDLTALFLENQVDLAALRDTGLGKMPLVSDAVALGIGAESIMIEEAQQQPPQQ
tara:strand:+ start:2143 stop:3960 length:1818 start_codon:yes stop_codon:yes gene_type:complete